MAQRFVGVDMALDRVASVAVIVAAITLVWVLLGDRRSERGPGSAGVEEVDQVVGPPRPVGVRGDAGARVAIVEFSDFECPFCGRHARDTYPRLVADYVATGEVQYVFRHYPLDIHPLAFKAAEAVECAARQGMFWEMHDRLFEAGGALAEPDLSGYAASLGLREEEFETCFQSGATAERVREDRRQGEALGVSATPTFFFARVHDDGRLGLLVKLSGARPYSAFQSELDELLSDTDAAAD